MDHLLCRCGLGGRTKHNFTRACKRTRLHARARGIVLRGTGPVGAQTFTGRSTSKCLNFFSSNAPIEISINWCMERGHMNLHRTSIRHNHSLSFFCNFWFFFLQSLCKVKRTLLRGTVPLLRGSPPHERVSRTELSAPKHTPTPMCISCNSETIDC